MFSCENLIFYLYFVRFLLSRFDKKCGEVRLEHCADRTFYVYIMVYTHVHAYIYLFIAGLHI